MNKDLFPLPLVLLPGGISRLKVFEAKYIRLVKAAIDGQGFVLCSRDQNRPLQLSEYGSWVKIIDFDSSEDGILLIDIEAISVVKILSTRVADDQLINATVESCHYWPVITPNDTTHALAKILEQLFNQYSSLRQFYANPHFNDPNWVCMRWLEVLPLTSSQQCYFFTPDSLGQALDLLCTLVLAEKPLLQ